MTYECSELSMEVYTILVMLIIIIFLTLGRSSRERLKMTNS